MDDQSLWKKELSFGRKPKDQTDADESPATDEKPTSMWKKELSFKRKPKADAVEDDVVADTPAEEPTAEEPKVEEPVAAEPVAAEPEVVEETVWKKEVSFSRPPEAEPVAERSPDEEPVVEEEPVADEEPVAEAGLVAAESVEVEASAEPWDAAPAMPPAPVAEAQVASVSAPTPSEVIHPPVAAADLPSIVGADAPKVPFWKKELSLGGKKGDKPVKEHKQKALKVKAERVPKTKEPKEPKQPKERKQKTPKVKAERGNAKGRLTGLKIGASQLAAARVSNNGSAELLQVAREPLAPGIIVGGELRDPDALAEALKDF